MLNSSGTTLSAHLPLRDPSRSSEADDRNLIQPCLLIEDDLGQWQVVLDQQRYWIGRSLKNDIHLNSQFVSRHHALLVRMGPKGCTTYQVMDGKLQGQPSTNGLLINGRRQEVWQLCHGDRILFGPKAQVTYCYPPPAEADTVVKSVR
jgi:pSer/pThr/pTyr-binding forkhead associated (FHA) protein